MAHLAIRLFTLIIIPLASGVPAAAQPFPIDPTARQAETVAQSQGEGLRDAARTANVGIGEVGQRQTKLEIAPHIEPLGRIDNRIPNRIENRIRNRIDRNYDPTANTTSPFRRAEDQARQPLASTPRR